MRKRDPELAIRDQQIYQLYVKDKWTLEALAALKSRFLIAMNRSERICIRKKTID